MKQNQSFGGFAAVNTGKIENCFSLLNLAAPRTLSGGFVGKNAGSILHSFCSPGQVKTKGGFAGDNTGHISGSFFFHGYAENSAKIKRLSDGALGQKREQLKGAEDAAGLDFDLDEIWSYREGEKAPLRFQDEGWMFDVTRSPRYRADADPVVIRTAQDLLDVAKKINDGDPAYLSAYLVLDSDLDLGGQKWTPIGQERPRAFSGLFDGSGHSVTNFVMNDKKAAVQGFFGYLKGEVYNLTVDCSIRSNATAGGIAACCEEGIIGCCAAVVDLRGKAVNLGGLVGSNSGTVFQSYSAGRGSLAPVPWWLLPGLPALLAGAGVAAALILFALPKGDSVQVFAPVPYDPDAVVDPEAQEVQPNGDGNFVSFQFEQAIDVDLATGLCAFNFKNPGESNHNIVVQLQFTDSQAVSVMGSTGRTAEEQQKLETTDGYDADTYRTVIAESGSIRPGYMLESLKLVEQPNGATLPAGTYQAIVYLIFYDIDTNNRAMLESQLPVVITVH